MASRIFTRYVVRAFKPDAQPSQLLGPCFTKSTTQASQSSRCMTSSFPKSALDFRGFPLSKIASAGGRLQILQRSAHTQADGELSMFLLQEIEREKQNMKERASALHPDLKDWQAEKKGALVTLRRNFEDEQIVVRFNVNNSVGQGFDNDVDHDDDPGDEASRGGGGTRGSDQLMLSRPAFEVEVKRGNTTLAFNCAISDSVMDQFASVVGVGKASQQQREQPRGAGTNNEFVDLFEIEEVAVFEGKDMDEGTYVVSGDVMDGDMYEHIMNMLDDRGIGPEFTVDMVKLATQHEQEQYVNLLEKFNLFVGPSTGGRN